MTLPLERKRAVENTREFLLALLDPKRSPRVPKATRLRARSLLKHYPTELDLLQSQDLAPQVWGHREPMPKYWMCEACARAQGAVYPKGGVGTVCLGTCGHCEATNVTLIPWVDFDWPKNKAKTLWARLNRD